MVDPRFRAKCDAVTRVIEPAGTAPWLTEYFVYWATPLASEWSVALLQPTRKKMKESLTSIVRAADTLNDALSNPTTMGFLERAHGSAVGKELSSFRECLRSI